MYLTVHFQRNILLSFANTLYTKTTTLDFSNSINTTNTMRAAREVFGIVELVENIFSYLGVISRLRAQQVNRFCKAVFDGSAALKRPFGFLSAFEKPVDDRSNTKFNPLIASLYITPSCKYLTSAQYHVIKVHWFAASAVKAAQSSRSGLYRISATLPPVKSIRIIFFSLRIPSHAETITNSNGVSVGDILATWSKSESLRSGREFCVCLDRI